MSVPIAVFRLTEYLDKYIRHPRQQNYPMNLAPFTHPSVYLSVFPFATPKFSELERQFFLIFCLKLDSCQVGNATKSKF